MPRRQSLSMDERRRFALRNQNYRRYAELCINSGTNPEDSHAFEQGQLELSLEERKPIRRKRNKTEQYEIFLEMSSSSNLDPNKTFEDVEAKREVMKRSMGYRFLNARGGEKTPIDDCSNAKIGNTFKSTYITAERSVKH